MRKQWHFFATAPQLEGRSLVQWRSTSDWPQDAGNTFWRINTWDGVKPCRGTLMVQVFKIPCLCIMHFTTVMCLHWHGKRPSFTSFTRSAKTHNSAKWPCVMSQRAVTALTGQRQQWNGLELVSNMRKVQQSGQKWTKKNAWVCKQTCLVEWLVGFGSAFSPHNPQHYE